MLDRKLRILRAEQERLAAEADAAEARWREEHAEAETWLLRAALLGHRRGVLTAADRPEAELVLGRATAAGVGFPVVVRFTVPERPAGSAAPAASAATDRAGTACAPCSPISTSRSARRGVRLRWAARHRR